MIFSCWKNISLVRCAHSSNIFQHSKRNFVSPRGHVISSIFFFRTFVLRKLFDIRFSYKHCNFSRACLLVKVASITVTRSIISIFDGIAIAIPGASTVETGAVLSWDMIALVLTFSDNAVYPPKSTSEYKVALSPGCLACENIRFSSLFVDGDVSRGGTSATQRQKFHTDDVKSVRNPVRSADWSTE